MGSVEILLYCYKAICVAFLLELNYYVSKSQAFSPSKSQGLCFLSLSTE